MVAIASLVMAATAPAAVPATPIDPIVAFQDVCIKGEARFSKAQVAAVGALPARARRELEAGSGARLFVTLSQDDLVAIAVTPAQGNKPQVCELFADRLDESRLAELGFQMGSLNNCTPGATCRMTSWSVDSSYGYSLRASRVGSKAMVLKSIMYPEEAQARRTADMNVLKDASASEAARTAAAQRLTKEGK